MHSTLAVIHLTIDHIREQVKAMPTQYILSKENTAGLATRSETSLSMLGPNSLYQIGPHCLTLPGIQWPASRSLSNVKFPDNEYKTLIRTLVLAAENTSLKYSIVVNALKMCNAYYNALRKDIKNPIDSCLKHVSQNDNYTSALVPSIYNSEASHRVCSLFLKMLCWDLI